MSPGRPTRPNPTPSVRDADVMVELERILASREFSGADRLCRFLRLVVERTLAGDRDGLKESVIGTDVFGREPGYDAKTEPVVRTAALRLRAKLEEYYAEPGRSHMVRISIPKGAYLAVFEAKPRPIALPPPAAEPAPPPTRKLRWALAAAGLVAVAACAWFILRPPASRPQPVQSTVTSYPGRQEQPALSPDGSQVAFVWGGESSANRDIYVTMTAGGTARRVTTDPAADEYPAWAPDGSTIAFVRETKSLMLITPLGTNERRLTSAYAGKLSWSPDGKRIVFCDWQPNRGPLAIFSVDARSGERRQLTAPGGAWPGDVSAEVSPDGREIAFVRWDRAGVVAYRIPAAGGEPRLVHRMAHETMGGLAWSPDSRSLVYSLGRGGEYLLWSIPVAGGSPQPVPLTGDDNRNPGFGRSLPARLVWEHSIRDSNVWRLDLGSPRTERIVASTRLDSSPQLSPDGRSLLFVSDRSGNFQIWRAAADGGNPVQLTKYTYEYPGSARWSPDASRIAFDLRADEGRAIFVMDAAGGVARQWTPWREGSRPSWSHDGQWIYYADRAPDNRLEIWKVSAAAPGAPQRMTNGGGSDPLDSPDGKTVYFVRGHGDLWSMPAGGGSASVVLPEGVPGGWFSVTQRGIFFVDLYSGRAPALAVPRTPKTIWLLPYGAAKPVEAGRIDGEITRETPDFTVSADGLTAFFSILETSTSQIRMLEWLP